MGRLIYSMITSLDGYAIDAEGRFDFSPVTEEVHRFIAAQMETIDVFLLGRRMYETMLFWETADLDPAQLPFVIDFARRWQDTKKIIYSTTLQQVSSARTRIERSFDPGAIHALKSSTDGELNISGPELAAQAIRAGLVDEYQPIIGPTVAGGGTPFFPAGLHLDLELLEEHRFVVDGLWLRYVPQARDR